MAEIEEYNKFKSVGKPLAWRQTIMDEVLQNGLTGEIPENEYIEFLKAQKGDRL